MSLSIEKQFDKFINEPSLNKNKWLESESIIVYVRYRKRMIDSEFIYVIDIANVTVESCKRRKGIFRNFMKHVESYNIPIYIESIMSPRMADIAIKQGYKFIGKHDAYRLQLNSKRE